MFILLNIFQNNVLFNFLLSWKRTIIFTDFEVDYRKVFLGIYSPNVQIGIVVPILIKKNTENYLSLFPKRERNKYPFHSFTLFHNLCGKIYSMI